MPTAVDRPKKAFRTHSNYLQAFQLIITEHYQNRPRLWVPGVTPAVLDGVAASVRASHRFSSIARRPAPRDLSALRGCLRNAWGTELLLLAARKFTDDQLFGVANNWAVVQAYYACYHAAQALIIAQGRTPPQDHTSTLHESAEFWTRHSLAPWSLGYRAAGYLKFPRDVDESVHNLGPCDYTTCWDLAAKALRTTRSDPLRVRCGAERQRQRKDRRKQWKLENEVRLAAGKAPKDLPPNPKLSQEDRTRIDAKLSPTTLLDYLCRLRVRSNYKDPTMFTDGPDDPRESRWVHENLCGIATATLLVHELHIARLIGRSALRPIAEEWANTQAAKSAKAGLSTRYSILFPQAEETRVGGHE
jgi:hypothetical protein